MPFQPDFRPVCNCIPHSRAVAVPEFSFNHMITQGYPLHYKVDPFKLQKASNLFFSSNQLEIDFGKDFDISYEARQNRFNFQPTIVTCVLCKKERELFDRLPFEYDGRKIFLSPYSEVYGEVCIDCFHKHDGWEIIKLSDRRRVIEDEIRDSRTVLGKRYVLVEKVGHIIQDEEDKGGYHKKFVSPGIFANVE